ncbi:MAG: DNA internalization-related competence protein ComEC/Rec2 [Eubacteriales bacterium]
MRKLGWFAVGFALATLSILGNAPTQLIWWQYGLMTLVALALVFLKPTHCKRIGCGMLGLCVCLVWLQHLETEQQDWNQCNEGNEELVTMVATDFSEESAYGYMVLVSLDGCEGWLYFSDDVAISPGDTITATCRIKANSTYGDWDNLWKKALGYDFTANYKGDDFTCISPESVDFIYYPACFAQKIREMLPVIANETTSNYLHALLLGESDYLSDMFYNNMAIIGTNHTVAISGMHFSMLMTLLVLFLGRGRRGAFLTLAVIWFYAVAVGGKPSVIRSAVMFTFLLMAPIVGRERDVATSILGALLAILAENPFAIYSISLQFSFTTVALICLFTANLYEPIWNHSKVKIWRKKSRLVGVLVGILGQPFCCSLAVIPATVVLGAYYFEVFSIISPLSNMLIQPAVALLFCLALPVVIMGMGLPAVATVLMTPLEWLVEYIIFVTNGLAKIPYAAVFTNNGYMVILALFFFCISLFYLVSKEKNSLVLLAFSVAVMLVGCYGFSAWEYRSQDLTMTMLDVGQGQSIYLESDGESILYDCGGSVDNPGEEVARYLETISRFGLDSVVISHYDSDHAGGLPYLLERTEIRRLYLPPYDGESTMEAQIVEVAEAQGVEIIHVDTDILWHIGRATAQLYAPVSLANSNDSSLALLVSMGDYDALMTGDMGVSAEKALVYQKDIPDLEVLVAGHHGSETSTSLSILQRTCPETLLISVGEDNLYGHPSDVVLERIAATGARVYRTDIQGNITIRR